MSEINGHISNKIPSEKNFALVFAGFFALVAFYPLFFGENYRLWALVFSCTFLGLAFTAPQILYYPNLAWFKLGNLLGAIVAPIVISIVYFTTVVPIGLFFRLTKKDLIHQNLDHKRKSYWIKRSQSPSSMKNQF